MAIRSFDGEHVWQVGCTLPKDETKGRRYAKTCTLNVVASTAGRAIECAREYYGPECVVYAVQHRSSQEATLVFAEEVFDASR